MPTPIEKFIEIKNRAHAEVAKAAAEVDFKEGNLRVFVSGKGNVCIKDESINPQTGLIIIDEDKARFVISSLADLFGISVE